LEKSIDLPTPNVCARAPAGFRSIRIPRSEIRNVLGDPGDQNYEWKQFHRQGHLRASHRQREQLNVNASALLRLYRNKLDGFKPSRFSNAIYKIVEKRLSQEGNARSPS